MELRVEYHRHFASAIREGIHVAIQRADAKALSRNARSDNLDLDMERGLPQVQSAWRVVLDFELKKDLYQALSRMRPDKDPRYERIFIANQFDLKVVEGKIPIPDLRIEYEDECRDAHRLDLEIATRDYRPQGLGEKAKAGFHMFARQQDHAKLRRVLDTQEISARIFAL
jgi:hypothetical protein